MRKIQQKKAAIELSMTTIIVVVLSLVMLILGFFLVRNIMCGAITFSDEINQQTKNEIQNIYQTSEGELNCFGGGREPAYISPGEVSYILCSINAKETKDYRIVIERLYSLGGEVSEAELKSWILENTWGPQEVSPNDETIKKVGAIKLPEEAPLVQIRAILKAERKDNTGKWTSISGSKDIDLEIKEKGTLRATIC